MMNKLLLSVLLAIPHADSFSPSLPSMHSAVTATSVARGAVLEGREIEGTLTPTNNFVLVKVAKAVEQTTGGILLTGSVRTLSRGSVWCFHGLHFVVAIVCWIKTILACVSLVGTVHTHSTHTLTHKPSIGQN